eukprot:7681638-Pyramimonas_sp.AAC.1
MAQYPPSSPLLARSVSLCVSLLYISRQLSWAGLLNGLVGIREAYSSSVRSALGSWVIKRLPAKKVTSIWMGRQG